MNPDRFLEAAAIIQQNTGIDVRPAKQPTLLECASMIQELHAYLTPDKIAYRSDARQITSSLAKAHRLFERIIYADR